MRSPRLIVTSLGMMSGPWIRSSIRSRGRFTAIVLGVFALIAIGLASVGMYGVAAYSSAARIREFALRMAGRLGRRAPTRVHEVGG